LAELLETEWRTALPESVPNKLKSVVSGQQSESMLRWPLITSHPTLVS